MTTPKERFRSLRWAREFLAEVQLDPLVSQKAKDEAAALLAAFPSDAMLRALIRRGALGLPGDVALPMGDAVAWLANVRADMTPACSLKLRYVRRHLPTPEIVYGLAADFESPSALAATLDHWLFPDVDAD